MTLDEAIKHCLEVANSKEIEAEFETDYVCYFMTDKEREECKECAAEHRQLAEWLTDYKEAKRLLKAAVEDFFFVAENFINNMDSLCSMYNHISGCVKGCPMSSSDDYGRCKWRYADEALKLIES